jgi:hypothetical protein
MEKVQPRNSVLISHLSRLFHVERKAHMPFPIYVLYLIKEVVLNIFGNNFINPSMVHHAVLLYRGSHLCSVAEHVIASHRVILDTEEPYHCNVRSSTMWEGTEYLSTYWHKSEIKHEQHKHMPNISNISMSSKV